MGDRRETSMQTDHCKTRTEHKRVKGWPKSTSTKGGGNLQRGVIKTGCLKEDASGSAF